MKLNSDEYGVKCKRRKLVTGLSGLVPLNSCNDIQSCVKTFLLSSENRPQNVLLPTQKCTIAQYFSQQFPKPGRNVFTRHCRIRKYKLPIFQVRVRLRLPTGPGQTRRRRPRRRCRPCRGRLSRVRGEGAASRLRRALGRLQVGTKKTCCKTLPLGRWGTLCI